jgi:AcrR family transcriptional regulator
MARTTLSRKSFYVYFRDRAELLTALVSPLRADADVTLRAWRESADTVKAGRVALASAANVYQRHGQLLRALADAAGRDAEAGAVWRSLIDPVIDVAAAKIVAATAAGESSGLDPYATARALVSMNVAYFFDQLAGKPEANVQAVVDTLTTIWQRTIYNRDPA